MKSSGRLSLTGAFVMAAAALSGRISQTPFLATLAESPDGIFAYFVLCYGAPFILALFAAEASSAAMSAARAGLARASGRRAASVGVAVRA